MSEQNLSQGSPQEYEPFGEEWRKEMSKFPKVHLITFLADAGKKLDRIPPVIRTAMQTGEPVFILRARDIFAPDTVRFWAGQLEMTRGKTHPKTEEAYLLADKMEDWQKSHDRKIPD